MSRPSVYTVTLPSGQKLEASVDPTTFGTLPRGSDAFVLDYLERLIAMQVSHDLEPQVRAVRSVRELQRDEAGRIVRMVEVPADSPAQMAADAGAAVAHQFMSEVER